MRGAESRGVRSGELVRGVSGGGLRGGGYVWGWGTGYVGVREWGGVGLRVGWGYEGGGVGGSREGGLRAGGWGWGGGYVAGTCELGGVYGG